MDVKGQRKPRKDLKAGLSLRSLLWLALGVENAFPGGTVKADR